jgi:hypothetical protein
MNKGFCFSLTKKQF